MIITSGNSVVLIEVDTVLYRALQDPLEVPSVLIEVRQDQIDSDLGVKKFYGVGGIEAEAAMLGQAVTMLIPEVVGFELKGQLPEGTTATDLVLTVVEILREAGVVGKFVEFFGDGLDHLSLADKA